MFLSRKKHHWNAIRKGGAIAVELVVFADWAANFIHNSVTSYIAITGLLVGLDRNRDVSHSKIRVVVDRVSGEQMLLLPNLPAGIG